jgi:MFS family permease
MRFETRRHELPTILKAATTYFVLVFGAGFVLGPIRILFIVPRFGVRVAELIEAPIMLVVIVLAAKWLVRRFSLARNALPVGFLALSFMIAFEFTLVLWLRGLTPAEYFRDRDPVSGTVYYLMLLVFAVMPFLISHKARSNKARSNNDSLHS